MILAPKDFDRIGGLPLTEKELIIAVKKETQLGAVT